MLIDQKLQEKGGREGGEASTNPASMENFVGCKIVARYQSIPTPNMLGRDGAGLAELASQCCAKGLT